MPIYTTVFSTETESIEIVLLDEKAEKEIEMEPKVSFFERYFELEKFENNIQSLYNPTFISRFHSNIHTPPPEA